MVPVAEAIGFACKACCANQPIPRPDSRESQIIPTRDSHRRYASSTSRLISYSIHLFAEATRISWALCSVYRSPSLVRLTAGVVDAAIVNQGTTSVGTQHQADTTVHLMHLTCSFNISPATGFLSKATCTHVYIAAVAKHARPFSAHGVGLFYHD
jgi:hypothetical protein